MRFSVPLPCFFGSLSFKDAVARVAALGFDAVEIYDWTHLDLKEARRILVGNGVELISMCTTDFRLTDSDYRMAWLDGMRHSVEAAQILGTHRLITQSGPEIGTLTREKQHRSMQKTLSLAAPYLEESGVTMMLEPLNVKVDHKGCFLFSSAEAFEIVSQIDSPGVRVVYDCYHQQITEGNIVQTVLDNLPLIAHLHAAGNPGRHELQSGELDYRNIFATADAAGYTGACGIEYNPIGDPEESLRNFRRIYCPNK